MSHFNPFLIPSHNESTEWFRIHSTAMYRFLKNTLSLPCGKTLAFSILPASCKKYLLTYLDMTRNPDGDLLKNMINTIFQVNENHDFSNTNDPLLTKIFNTIYPIVRKDFIEENPKWLKTIFPYNDETILENCILPTDFFALIQANVMEKFHRENPTRNTHEEEFCNTYMRYLITKSKLFKNTDFFSPEENTTGKQLYRTLEYFFFYTHRNLFLKTEAYLKFFEHTVTFYQNYTGLTHTGMSTDDLITLIKITETNEPPEKNTQIQDGVVISNNLIQDVSRNGKPEYCMNIFDKKTKKVYGIIFNHVEKGDTGGINIGDEIQADVTGTDKIHTGKNNLILELLGVKVHYITGS